MEPAPLLASVVINIVEKCCLTVSCINHLQSKEIPELKVVVNPLFAQFAIATRSIWCALFRIHLITAVKQAEIWHLFKDIKNLVSMYIISYT